MSNFLQDIKEDVGYYYVDEQYDLTDFVMLILNSIKKWMSLRHILHHTSYYVLARRQPCCGMLLVR
ncbi:MAG: hypothetical protein UE295_09535 [Acutalibacteraceae bacterium]|nr:hypothetical protein [Acutalibacteraceae bacterium]